MVKALQWLCYELENEKEWPPVLIDEARLVWQLRVSLSLLVCFIPFSPFFVPGIYFAMRNWNLFCCSPLFHSPSPLLACFGSICLAKCEEIKCDQK